MSSLASFLRRTAETDKEFHLSLLRRSELSEFKDALPSLQPISTDLTESDYQAFLENIQNTDLVFSDRYALYWSFILMVASQGKAIFEKPQLKEAYLSLLSDFSTHFEFPAPDACQSKRVLLFCNQYRVGSEHSPTEVANQWIGAFRALDYEVMVISSTPTPYPFPDGYWGSFNQNAQVAGQIYQLTEGVKFVELSGSPDRQIVNDFFENFMPSPDEACVLIGHSHILFDSIPCSNKVQIPTGENSYISTADRIVWAEKFDQYKNIEGSDFQQIKGPSHYQFSKGIFSPPNVVSVKTLNLVVVGNRLSTELNDEFWSGIRSLMKARDVQLHIVGPLELSNVPGDLKAKVVLAGFQADLSGYFKNMHFFLNPPRVGGGTSGRLAIMSGLPVITLPYGDVYQSMEDAYHLESFEGLASFVESYADNPETKTAIDNINKYLAEKYQNSQEVLLKAAKAIVYVE